MEADDLWMEFDDKVAHLVVERRPVGARNLRVLIEPQLLVVALQALPPEFFPSRIDSWRSVAKEIHVDGATGLPAYGFQFAPHLFEA